MREGWAEAVPRKVILILDICALVDSIGHWSIASLNGWEFRKQIIIARVISSTKLVSLPTTRSTFLPTAVERNANTNMSRLIMARSAHGTIHDADDS